MSEYDDAPVLVGNSYEQRKPRKDVFLCFTELCCQRVSSDSFTQTIVNSRNIGGVNSSFLSLTVSLC